MINCIKKISLLALAVCTALYLPAQVKPKTPTDTPDKPAKEILKAEPKPYNDVITEKAKTSKGFFTVHKVEEKYYLKFHHNYLAEIF